MKKQELIKCCKAIEFLFQAKDITQFTEADYENFDTKGAFVITFTDTAKEFLKIINTHIQRDGVSYYNISDKQKTEDNLVTDTTIDLDALLAVAKILKDTGVCSFTDIPDVIDPNLRKELEEIDKTFDYTQTFQCEIADKLKIEDTEEEVKTLLALCDYPEGLAQKMFEHHKKNHEFHLKAFEKFEVRDNRIYIPLSKADLYRIKSLLKTEMHATEHEIEETMKAKAIVISKNLNDYFYCSYGNAFQSCFALNSSYSAWYGYLPFNMADESLMIYATTGKVQKASIINGCKFHLPNMLFRAWGYVSAENNLVVDKRYKGSTFKIEPFIKLLKDKFNAIVDGECNLYNDGKGIRSIWTEYGLGFYADSLRHRSDGVFYKYACGVSGTEAAYKPSWKKAGKTLISVASTVVEVSKTLDLSKPCVVIEGKLFNPKQCPITGIQISEEMDKHPYAKYFTNPVNKIVVLTYDNGVVRYDYNPLTTEPFWSSVSLSPRNTGGFNCGTLFLAPAYSSFYLDQKISLKSLKELLKGSIKSMDEIDAILLRTLEYDKVTCQVFKK